MTGRLLDVSRFPQHQSVRCDDGTVLEIADIVTRHHSAITELADHKLVREQESMGFVMTRPMLLSIEPLSRLWDNPEDFVWFAGGWGDDRDGFIANAVRKMRPLLRRNPAGFQFTSTLQIRRDAPDHFEDIVLSASRDPSLPWGDFPWGGAVIFQMGNLLIGGAVSAFSEIEDDTVVRLLLGSIAGEIAQHNDMFPRD